MIPFFKVLVYPLYLPVVDIYPSSCEDLYTRDNIMPSTTSVTVMIDIDGATTTNSPVSVVCSGRREGARTQICTNVGVKDDALLVLCS